MKRIKKQHKKEQRDRIPVARIVLGIVIIAGIIPLIAVAPGLGYAFKYYGVHKRLQNKTYLNNVLSRLKQSGYIVFEERHGRRYVRITNDGREYFYKKRTALLFRQKKRPWDGYWRIVMFDIPEKQRGLRNVLRNELSEVGFKKLQGSVWVSPDECEEYIRLLKADKRIGKRLIYLKTRDIEYGSALRALFSIT